MVRGTVKFSIKWQTRHQREGITGAAIYTNCKHLIRQHLVALIPRRVRAGRSKILIEESKIGAAGYICIYR